MSKPLRVAVVHKSFGLDGGTERMTEALVRGLSARGHELHVFAGSVDPRFRRVRMAHFHPLGVGGPGGGLRALRLLLSAALRVRRSNYDVVLHMGRSGPLDVYRAGGGCHRTWYELLRQRLSGAKRALLGLSLRHRLALWHERRALSRGLVVVPSELARQDLVTAYGALGGRAEVIPNGVDLDRFHPKTRQLHFGEQREALGVGPEELVMLFVGSDAWRKGLDRTLAAFARLAPRREELRLLVLGDDRRRAHWEAEAERMGVRSRVAFLARYPAPEKVYAAADLLVLPTRHDPFANVTLEALGCGVPVVTTATNGAATTLGAGPALAVVADADDADALAEACDRLLQPAEMPQLRQAARETAERWGEGPFVDAWEALLTRIARGRA